MNRFFARICHGVRGNQGRKQRPISGRPIVELLEDRCVPANIAVTSFVDGGLGTGSLRDAILQTNNNNQSNTITLPAGTYSLSLAGRGEDAAAVGDLDIKGQILNIEGVGGQAIIDGNRIDRIFEVFGATVTLKNVTITRGQAMDAGGVGGSANLGGGILNNGGTLILNNVQVLNNRVEGVGNGDALGGGIYSRGGSLSIMNSVFGEFNIAVGGQGVTGGPGFQDDAYGKTGGQGGTALGGGLHAENTPVTISNSQFGDNIAQGGQGGQGGNSITVRDLAAPGGTGGKGGTAQGGSISIRGSSLTITGSTIGGLASGGEGGSGGFGGTGLSAPPTVISTSASIFATPSDSPNSIQFYQGGPGSNNPAGTGGQGGLGGEGGLAQGGAIYASGADVSIRQLSKVQSAVAKAGDGGSGGTGGKGGQGFQGHLGGNQANNEQGGRGGVGGTGGLGGIGGLVQGGGLFITAGSFSLTSSQVVSNLAEGGDGGKGGNGGTGGKGGDGAQEFRLGNLPAPGNGGDGGNAGNGNIGGAAQGGGLFDFSKSSISSSFFSSNSAQGGHGGQGGMGGTGDAGGKGGEIETTGGIGIDPREIIGTQRVQLPPGIPGDGGRGGDGGSGAWGGTTSFGSSGNGVGGGMGGGIFARGTGVLSIVNSTIERNAALRGLDGAGGPGGFAGSNPDHSHDGAEPGTPGLDQTSALGSAGAGGILARSPVSLYQTTIVENRADSRVGGVQFDAFNSTIQNSIIGLNTLDRGDNVFKDIYPLTGQNTIGNNLIGIDPKLGNLVSPANGIPYRPLLPGSPAIDAVTDYFGYWPELAVDQRGLTRTVGPTINTTGGTLTTAARDIGAIEYQYDLSVSGTVTPTSVAVGGNLTYAITVQNVGDDAGATALTIPLPAGTTFVSLTHGSDTAGANASTLSIPAVGGTGTVTVHFASFPDGRSAAFTLVLKVDSTNFRSSIATTMTLTPDANDNLRANTLTLTAQVPNPAPAINELGPVAQGGNGVLIVKGMNFTEQSQVRINGTARTTQYISATQLQATLAPGDYANPGSVVVTVLNPGNLASAPVSLIVADGPITGAAQTIQASVGKAFTGVVAQFSQAGNNHTANQYTATINWGDGTQVDSNATIAALGSEFIITGTHTYQVAGNYSVEVTITSVNGARTSLSYPLAWTRVADMAVGRWLAASAMGPDGRLYVMGGQTTSGQHLRSAEAYDPGTNQWSTLADMPSLRFAATATMGADGRIYVLGGVGTVGKFVDAYNVQTNQWTRVASMSTNRASAAAAVGPDGKVYVFGGNDYGNPLKSVEAYNYLTNTWSPVADMPVPRQSAAAVRAPDGKIYLFGGDTDRVDVYDPVANRWSVGAPMPTPRSEVGAAFGPFGLIYVFGGSQGGANGRTTVEAYDYRTNTWTTALSLTNGRAGPVGGTGPAGQLIITGGSGSELFGGYLRKTEVLAPQKLARVIVGSPPTAHESQASTNENTVLTLTPAYFNFVDVDAGDTLQAIQLISGPTAGSLKLNGSVITSGIVSRADLAAGKLVFTPANNSHGTPYATFTFKVSDGQVFSADAATFTINVVDVNQAPVIKVGGSVARIVNEDADDGNGFLVADIVNDPALGYSDADANSPRGIAVLGESALENGHWEYSVNGGQTWTDFGPGGYEAATLLQANSTDRVRFVANGTIGQVHWLDFIAWDQSNGKPSGSVINIYEEANIPPEDYLDPSKFLGLLQIISGGSTAYSRSMGQLHLTITAVNDAPTIQDTALEFDPIVKTSTIGGGSFSIAVSDLLIMVGYHDIDRDAGGIAITSSFGPGTWKVFPNQTIGDTSATNVFLVRSTDTITFTSATNQVGFAGLTFRAWDRSSSNRDASATGGTTAFSTNVASIVFDVIDVQFAPGIFPGFERPYNLTIGPVIEGKPMTNVQAFGATDLDSATGQTDYNAIVNWGDGTSSVLTETPGPDGFVQIIAQGVVVANLSHTYDRPLTQAALNIEIVDTNMGGARIKSGNYFFDVLPSQVSAGAFSVPSGTTAGAAFDDAPLLHFSDASTVAGTSDFSATIAWGDGSVSTVTEVPGPDGQIVGDAVAGFDVQRSHSYARPGDYRVQIQVYKRGELALDVSSPTLLHVAGIAPTVSNFARNDAVEDTALSFSEANFTDHYNQSLNFPLQQIKITTLPSHGSLQLAGAAVAVNDIIFAGQFATVSYVPDANYNGPDEFQWTGSDGFGFAITPATVSITVAPVNDAPTLTLGDLQRVRSDAGPQDIVGWATDLFAGPANEFGQQVIIAVTNSNQDLFAVQPTIDASGRLTYTPAGDRNGFAVVTVTLTDDGGTERGGKNTSTYEFFIVVKDAPILLGANISASINSAQPTNNGVLVSDLIAGKITFLTGPAKQGIAVVGQTATNGTWQYSINGGLTWKDFGSVSDTSATLLGVSADDRIRFLLGVGTSTQTLTLRAWDQTNGLPTGTTGVDVSAHGATTPYSEQTWAIDTTVPTITLTSRTPPDGNGWNNTPVTIEWTVTSAIGLPAGAASGAFIFTSDGPNQSHTITVTDLAGNTSTKTISGVNIDTTPPTISASNIAVEATSADGATASFAVTASDALDGSPVVVISKPSGSVFALGKTTVQVTATDARGNKSESTFDVTVKDTTKPTISGTPDNRTVEARNPTGAIVTYTMPTATDLFGPVTVNAVPASGTLFPLGTTTVKITAQDANGNIAESSFDVVVSIPATGAGNVQVSVRGGRLQLKGDKLGNAVQITAGTLANSFIIAGLDQTTINGARSATVFNVSRDWQIDLGEGNDTLFLGGSTAMNIGGHLSVRMGGKSGASKVYLGNLTVAGNTSVDLGNGHDEIDVIDAVFRGAFALSTKLGDDDISVVGSEFRKKFNIRTGGDKDTVEIIDSVFASTAWFLGKPKAPGWMFVLS